MWAYPGTDQIFPVPPIISGTFKATNFKFDRYIHSVHANKMLLKICEKRVRGRSQGLPKFLQYPLLSQECVELRTSNLAHIFTRFIQAKGFLKILEKRERGCIQGLSKFFPVHPIISPTGESTNFKFANKSLLRIWEKRERWRIQGLPNFLKIPLIISGTCKATNFKFGKYIQKVHANKRPLKI